MSEWSNLPNAKHIDWVIQSVKDNPREWNAAWASAYDAAWNAEWGAAYDAARDAARDTARDAAWVAAYNTAWDTILALVAYDDIEHYFLSSYEELRLIYELTQHPAAILLLPAVKARDIISISTNL